MRVTGLISLVFPVVVLLSSVATAQQPLVQPIEPKVRAKPAPPTIEKLGPTLYRVGPLRVDTGAKEVTVAATLNDVMTLEFIANTQDGAKAYESALTINTDAITFNTALLLIGLDPAHGRPSKNQFDPAPAVGDPVEIWVSWGNTRVRVEDLILDRRTNKTLPKGAWAYTGSTFFDSGDGTGRHFMAEADGVLIGFMHGPSSIIDRVNAPTGYGALVRNTNLDVPPGGAVTVIIKALPQKQASR